MNVECQGNHRFYVAETAAVVDEGKICIVMVCLGCGEHKLIEHVIAQPGMAISLQKQKKD